MNGKKEKVVLAYSGGLDTSVILKWLQEEKDLDVIAYSAKLGEVENKNLKKKALSGGAVKAYEEDVEKEFADHYILPALKAGAVYEGEYFLATALGRPLIAKRMIDIAKKENAAYIAHGCTGKGNDQLRFEYTAAALAPAMKVIAPLREWKFRSREEEIDYAMEKGIKITATKKSPYSLDKNLWGISIECGVLEDPWNAPPEEIYVMTVNPLRAPNRVEQVTIDFTRGVPVALNGKKMPFVAIIRKLNEIGGRNGVGRIDLMENRTVGIKSREIYEAPAATILHKAHAELERLVLDKQTYRFKKTVSEEYSRLIYEGRWFSDLKAHLDAFVESASLYTTGTVVMGLCKGRASVMKRRSPYSLYNIKYSTYNKEDRFSPSAATGYITIEGLPLKFQGFRRSKS
jgi:argininosuccinate synthase